MIMMKPYMKSKKSRVVKHDVQCPSQNLAH